MVDTLEDIDKPYREGDSGRVERNVTWPSVEEAARRIEVLIEGNGTDLAARDLIVLMRELGRLKAWNTVLVAALEDIKRYANDYDDEWVPERVDRALATEPTDDH